MTIPLEGGGKQDKGKEKMEGGEAPAAFAQEVPDEPTWPPNAITDQEHAVRVAVAKMLHHAEALNKEAPP